MGLRIQTKAGASWVVDVDDRLGIDDPACRRFLQAFLDRDAAAVEGNAVKGFSAAISREFRCDARASLPRSNGTVHALTVEPRYQGTQEWGMPPYRGEALDGVPVLQVNCGFEWTPAWGCRRGYRGWSALFASTSKAVGLPVAKRRNTMTPHLCARPFDHKDQHVCHCGTVLRART